MTGNISLQVDHVHVWQIDLDGPTQDISRLLSVDECTRAENLKQDAARKRFIRGRGAMRAILGDYLGIHGRELKFMHGTQGKPALVYPESNIRFNLSHCEDMGLLAIAAIPVGIDLERIRTRPAQLKIARRMFSVQTYEELQHLPAEQFAAAFFQHWTELESRAKCVGDGIFSHEDGRNDITSRHFLPEDGWIACIATMGTDISTLKLKHFLYRN